MKKFLIENKEIIFATLLVTFTLGLYAPLEMYITNADSFWFTLEMFWWMPVLVFLVFTVLLFVIDYLILRIWGEKIISKIYLATMFATGICIWIQGNFLNISVGVMNGEAFPRWNYKPQMIRDAVIWLFILVICLVLSVKKKALFKKIATYLSALLIGMQLITLFFIAIPLFKQQNKEGDFLSNDNLYEVGADENVIVFVLDMFDDDYFKDILNEDPDITNNLKGFTYFSNHTGCYSTTSYSMGLFFTGNMFLNEMPAKKWIEEQGNKRLYMDEFLDDGYEVNIYTDVDFKIPPRIKRSLGNYKIGRPRIEHKAELTKQMYKLAMCKYLPNYFKKYIWIYGTEFEDLGDVFYGNNQVFRDEMNDGGISIGDAKKQLNFIHLFGAHYPYSLDENGNDIEFTYAEPVRTAKGVLNIVFNYLNQLKALNIYDDTTIVITADHGYATEGALTNPVFLVKPKNAHNSFNINEAPASQKDFAATLLDAAGFENYSEYGLSDFKIDEGDDNERKFYQYYLREGFYDFDKGEINYENGNIRLIEFLIPNNSNDVMKFELSGFEYTVKGDVIDHRKYCLSCTEDRTWEDTGHYKETLIHEPTEDNPGYDYLNHSFYEK